MVEIKIDSCPYCGGTNLSWGYQSAQGAVMTGKSGFAGSKVEHLVCTDCGSIVHSKVTKPELFRMAVKEKKPRKSRKSLRNTEKKEQEETNSLQ